MTDRTVRSAGLAGIVFVILILISVFAGGSMPKPDDSAIKIQKFFIDHRRGLLVGNFVGLIAIPFALWFAVALRELVRRDRLASAYGTALLAGLLVTAPMALVGGALQAAPVYVTGAARQVDANVLRLIFEGQLLAFVGTSAGIATFALASAAAIRRSGALPAYTMWLALLAVAGNVLAMISGLGAKVSPLGIFGVATFGLFVLVTGITMAGGTVTAVDPA
jgi:hypothetical protein